MAAHPVFGAGETDKRKPQKVCGKCFELLLPMQPYLTATNSKAMLQPDFSEVRACSILQPEPSPFTLKPCP